MSFPAYKLQKWAVTRTHFFEYKSDQRSFEMFSTFRLPFDIFIWPSKFYTIWWNLACSHDYSLRSWVCFFGNGFLWKYASPYGEVGFNWWRCLAHPILLHFNKRLRELLTPLQYEFLEFVVVKIYVIHSILFCRKLESDRSSFQISCSCKRWFNWLTKGVE